MIRSFVFLSVVRSTTFAPSAPTTLAFLSSRGSTPLALRPRRPFLRQSPSTTSIRCPVPFLRYQSPLTVRYIGKKARRRQRREKDRERGRYLTMIRDQKKLKRLHPAAQWKRILSTCDYWFSNTNLVHDDFLRTELKNHDGWCRISCLMTFPKFRHWVTPQLLVNAFTNAGPRYQLKDCSPTDSTAKNKLVRRRGVTLEHLEILECNPELYQHDNSEEIEERAAVRRKQRSLKKYKTNKDIVVVKDPKQLPKLCHKIRQSIQKSVVQHGTEDASVLALDAEFATLDEDIRPRLPAMLQMAAPEGPVGLIWLDKFPRHGRDVLNDSSYAPLASLLADSSIVKIGVGIGQDAKHLCSWWGINDPEYVGHFISRLQDLMQVPELETWTADDEDVSVGTTSGNRLQSLCALVLKRDLVKQKTNQKDKKRSHWRAPVLTERMKTYAAHDVACAVDIWMELKTTKGTDKQESNVDEESENEEHIKENVQS